MTFSYEIYCLGILIIVVSLSRVEFCKYYCDYDRAKMQYWQRGKVINEESIIKYLSIHDAQ